MEIDIGSVVECVNGEAGKLVGLIVERTPMKLVGLVVSQGRIVPQEVVVPMEVVRNVEPGRVFLRLTSEELGNEYHRLKESELVPLGDDWKTPPPDSPEEVVVTSIPAVGSEPPLVPVQSDLQHPFLLSELTNIPEGAVKLDDETKLMCPEGPVGNLHGLTFDATTSAVTQVLAKHVAQVRGNVAIPSYLIDRIEEGGIELKARKGFVESLPEVPPTEAK